ncbi:MarR family winged helix-turn-helix transcriptional regulator [Streptomyces jumonjinensis]|uniref:MarR family transcriptional regulator n=1 Tax=Streptomyces jumonjinensis TaxID=1945 RepID=A0A646KQU5_STRJU|nr:MarR family transcriptional regulator [Streptomyces jumonjinensis]MQT04251.1 MarR family transcriptional regulator [Streptomyces jumonjinensis]
METTPDTELLGSIRAVIRLARIAQQACEEAGLTLAQFRALNSAAKGGQRAYELARSTAVSRPAVSALTNGMVRMGLIERGGSAEDGRGVLFSITDQGVETLHRAEELLVERVRKVLGESGDGAVRALSALRVDEIEAALDAQALRDFGARPHRPGR